METLQIHKNIVCYDWYSLEDKPELRIFIERANLENFLESIQKNVILVLGWDGTMLRAVKENYEKDMPFLWINFGSKWFLLNDKEYLNSPLLKKKGVEGWYISRKYPLLEVKENNTLIWTALNDVNLYSPDGKVVDIDISLCQNQKTNIKWDWVIISTPAGSTGHNKSYNWPMLPHTSQHLIITPKWNLTPASSKIISNEKTIFITNAGRKNTLGVNVDGNQILLWKNIQLEISKSKKQVEFLILKNYLENWDNKVLWEQGFSS